MRCHRHLRRVTNPWNKPGAQSLSWDAAGGLFADQQNWFPLVAPLHFSPARVARSFRYRIVPYNCPRQYASLRCRASFSASSASIERSYASSDQCWVRSIAVHRSPERLRLCGLRRLACDRGQPVAMWRQAKTPDSPRCCRSLVWEERNQSRGYSRSCRSYLWWYEHIATRSVRTTGQRLLRSRACGRTQSY